MGTREVLLGADPRRSRRFVGGAALLAAVLVVAEALAGVGTWLGSGDRVYLFWLAVTALAAAVAYLNDGLLVGIAAAMLVDFGRAPGGAVFRSPTPVESVGYVLLSAVILGLPLGVTGYCLGSLLRRLTGRDRRGEPS